MVYTPEELVPEVEMEEIVAQNQRGFNPKCRIIDRTLDSLICCQLYIGKDTICHTHIIKIILSDPISRFVSLGGS